MLRFLEWYQQYIPNAKQLDELACSKVAKCLNLQGAKTVLDLARQIDILRIEFEAYINNVALQPPILLSAQGVPIDILAEAVTQLPQFRDKNFFFLLDEYENFEDYQQQVVNTLIKHAGQYYSFKIGVRELGWRRRTTLNENEQLIHPSDYVRINITEKLTDKKFYEFALNVCNTRISKLRLNDESIIQDISKALPNLSEDMEAEKLGVLESIESVKNYIKEKLSQEQMSKFEELLPLEAYFINFWAESKKQAIEETFQDYLKNHSEWNTRYQNYKHALLFTIRRKKRGIKKYYAGWDVFVKLAASNIRYLLELVDQSLLLHLKKGGSLSEPVPPEVQTLAAQDTGQKNLSELEGLSVHGAKLTKLLLGLGRIFQVMAADLSGHTPEVNQFHLTDNLDTTHEMIPAVKQLLDSAVMHLALLRFPGNKLTDEGDTRDYDYMMHPIFSPFFVFSHRSKRKMNLAGYRLLGLIQNQKETIREILAENNRSAGEDLPDQLHLFEGYYFGHS